MCRLVKFHCGILIYLGVRRERVSLSQEDRFARIYWPQILDGAGSPTSFGARLYTVREDSGYRDEELYVRTGQNGTMLVRCTLPAAEVPSPNCIGDVSLGDGLTATYRFKRAHIAKWEDIEAGTRALLGAFMVKSRD